MIPLGFWVHRVIFFRVGWRSTGHDIPTRTWKDAVCLWTNYVDAYLHLNTGIRGAKVYIVRQEDLIISQQYIHAQLHAIGLKTKRDVDDTPGIVDHCKQKPGYDLPNLESMQKRLRRSEFYKDNGQCFLPIEERQKITQRLADYKDVLLHLGYHHSANGADELRDV